MTDIGDTADGIAIVGVACRFPGARTVEEFWQNLRDGVESVSFFTEEELAASGVDPALIRDPSYVRAAGVLSGVELFDAAFFGFSPREAELMSPQHRLFLECAWEALERAGYDAARYPGRIGVYAGVGMNDYLLRNLAGGAIPDLEGDPFRLALHTGAFSVPLQASYKLNLRGPSVAVDTACSTSLVTVHLACQSLLNLECEMALAGGVRVFFPQKMGYLHVEGSVASPDGHCRAFDARAQGTLFGSGVGLVVLKRLGDALADGDVIHAVILGSAINNDGSAKAGFTAPGVRGQAAVIAEAQAIAGVEPETIGYVECHGTGTALGDPIEIAALNEAFTSGGRWTRGSCPLGSVKTNIGHLDTAAGVAGLIKAVLSLAHQEIPPSLHFERPNPKIDFDGGPFFVNATLRDWPAGGDPRRAGVTALGIGGTNAHLVLEEAPAIEPSGPSRPHQLLMLSAKTAAALEAAASRLSDHLAAHPDLCLADVAYTLQVGRQAFAHRAILVCSDLEDAANALGRRDGARLLRATSLDRRPSVRFMFPGQGAQHVNMAGDLYRTEPSFRAEVTRCSEILAPHLGLSLVDTLYPAEAESSVQLLSETRIAQPALFVIGYALARLWMSWGIRPDAMIGHSLGEYVAACLSGVLSLEDALRLVARRGALMQGLPRGAMLAVSLSEAELTPLLGPDCELAALNAPSACAVSGPREAIAALERELATRGVTCSRLQTSHAYHSKMMEPILEAFTREVAKVRLRAPEIPYISSLTGTWIEAGEATSAAYWAQQLRRPVRFAEGVQRLLEDPSAILLDIGPGITASTLARQQPAAKGRAVVSSSRRAKEERSDVASTLEALGQLWLAGAEVDWSSFYAHERRCRVLLSTYPFESRRYWLEPSSTGRPRATEILAAAPREHEERPLGMPTYVPARNEAERVVAEIMAQVLGMDRLGVHDDFFALGGSSLLAIQVIAKLRRALHVELTQHDLLRATTVAEIATVIGEAFVRAEAGPGAASTAGGLIEIQAGDPSFLPLFLVHPVGGHVYFYRALAQALGRAQPVYGFQADGLELGTVPLATIEEMAARYVDLLRAARPEGPYLLGGASFGGIVAYEMARRLTLGGQRVALLALLDSPGPGQLPHPLEDQAAILAYLADSFAPGHSLTEESLRRLDPDEQIRQVLDTVKGTALMPEGIELSEMRRFLTVFALNMKAMFDYAPEPYPGQVVFFRALERRAHFDPPNPELAWFDLAQQGTLVHLVPGDHLSMNEQPHVRAVADRLRPYLAELRSKEAAGG